MIDFNAESCLTLVEAAKLVPGREGQGGLHVSAIYRWVKRGVKGVHLETILIGGRMHTSREALQRFFESCSSEPTDSSRRRKSGRVDAEDDEILQGIRRTRGASCE